MRLISSVIKNISTNTRTFNSNKHVLLLLRSFYVTFLYKTMLAQSKKAECLHESSVDVVGE